MRYGQQSESGERRVCPGETNCEDFQSAAGETREAREQNVCIGAMCPAYPTKVNPHEPIYLENLVNSALVLRRLRESGYPRKKDEILATHFETLLMIDDLIEQYELVERRRTNELMSRMFGG